MMVVITVNAIHPKSNATPQSYCRQLAMALSVAHKQASPAPPCRVVQDHFA